MIRRLYDPKHIPKIIQYAKAFHAQSAFSHIPLDLKRCDTLLRVSLMAPHAAVWASYSGKDQKSLHGFLIGTVLDWPYLEGRYATDWAFCADRHADRLYRAFEQWAASHGANAIQMGVSSGSAQADAFYEQMGLTRVGGIYFREIAQ